MLLRRVHTLKKLSRNVRFVGTGVERDSVTVAVPATSANLGPGFDTLGMALDIWNTMKVERSDKFEIVVKGEGADELPCDETNLVATSLAKAFEYAGKPVPPLKYTCIQNIPHARGMGSSSAAITSGCLAGLILSGHRLVGSGKEEFLQIAAQIEGHADNVAPCIYGGIQIGVDVGEPRGFLSSRIPTPHGISCILFVPDFLAETKAARAVLPDSYTKQEVVHNIGRIATLVSALHSRRFEKLKYGVQDSMHQPYRQFNFPHLFPCIEAAEKAGAVAGYLSGAGPTVMAWASGRMGDVYAQQHSEVCVAEIGQAMKEAAESAGVTGRVYLTSPTDTGAQIVSASPPLSTASLERFTSWGRNF